MLLKYKNNYNCRYKKIIKKNFYNKNRNIKYVGERTLGEKQECHISFTIERQLKAYTECKDHTERHDILWHE